MTEEELLDIGTRLTKIDEQVRDALITENVNLKNFKLSLVRLELSSVTKSILSKSLFERELEHLFD